MLLALIDYGSGNLRSAAKAIARAATDAAIPLDLRVTSRVEDVRAADRIVLPGVGAFADCYRGLAALDGMIPALEEAVLKRARPFLGICVGMQLMAERGLEHGVHAGLGWISGSVEEMQPADPALKVPHMGWNELQLPGGKPSVHPVLAGISEGAHAYFVHSYHFRVADPAHLLASVDYGGPLAAVIGRDTLIGTQFHPEKSQATGLRFLTNFLRWRP